MRRRIKLRAKIAYRTRRGRANDCGRVSSERLWEEKFRLLTVASGLGCWTRLVEGVCSKLTLRYMSAIGWEAGSTRRVLAERIERNVTAPTTMTPPRNANGVGVSPIKRATHKGLRIGSRAWIRTASTAVNSLMAQATRMKGRPI